MVGEVIIYLAPTDRWGLAYEPIVREEDAAWADRDALPGPMLFPYGGMFSAANAGAMRGVIATLQPGSIMEIGVWAGRTAEHSSTDCILGAKPPGCRYVGVDIRDAGRRQHVETVGDEFCRFIQADSSDREAIEREMPEDTRPLDLLFIDGRHSLNQCLRDWQYAEWVRPGGVVLLHDVNRHPGPPLLFEAVDEELFDKADLFPGDHADYGMALLRRRD